MAFKRKTRRGGSGNRTTTTLNDKKGITRSSSWSSTGTQKTKSGGARYTNRINPDGSTTKIVTSHNINGWISRSQKTTGKFKAPKAPKSVRKPRAVRYSRGSSSRRGRSASPQEVMATMFLIGGIGVLYLIITYWQYILAAIGVGILGAIIYYSNKNK